MSNGNNDGRGGRLSKQDINYIKMNMDKSDEEIANEISKSPVAISNQKLKIAAEIKAGKPLDFTFNLRSRPWYKGLKRKFTDDELEVYEYEWNRIIAQFKEDVSATEEMQIQSLIETIILLDRNLEERKDSIEQLGRLKSLLSDKYKIHEDSRDKTWQSEVFGLESQIAALSASGKSNTDEKIKLESNKAKYLNELKATRASRNIMESGNTSWTALLKMLEEEESRMQEGRNNELVKLATQKELVRLSALHQFTSEPDSVETPFLTPELIEELEKEQENET